MKQYVINNVLAMILCFFLFGTVVAQNEKGSNASAKVQSKNGAPQKRAIADLKLTLTLIMPGSFIMGTPAPQPLNFFENPSSKKSSSHDEQQHKVNISSKFWMGCTEVTQMQFETVMGNNPSANRGPDKPVEMVSWYDAVAFCTKLTERERKAGRLSGDMEYRLPTEAEWEYCCRAGTKGKYHFGDDALQLTNYGWFYGNSGDKALKGTDLSTWNHDKLLSNNCRSHSVGSKKPNDWGLYDMHGNVSEWCLDWQVDYKSEPQTDPSGAAKGALRIHRGGTWYGPADWCRSGRRNGVWPKHKSNTLGFRVVLASVRTKESIKKANKMAQPKADR